MCPAVYPIEIEFYGNPYIPEHDHWTLPVEAFLLFADEELKDEYYEAL